MAVEAYCHACGSTVVKRPSRFHELLSCGCQQHAQTGLRGSLGGRKRSTYTVGHKWGRLHLLELDIQNDRSARYARLQCECGQTTEAALTNLVAGRTTSCGCAFIGPGTPKWGGCACGRVSGAWLSQIRQGATVRAKKGTPDRYHIGPRIDPEYICSLFDTQENRCSMSGLPIQGDYVQVDGLPSGPIWKPLQRTASLDRSDPQVGYVVGNVSLVYIPVNKVKADLTTEDFLALCRAVTYFSTGNGAEAAAAAK